MSKQRIGFALSAILLLSLLWISPAQAQGPNNGWSEPYRLSSDDGKASEGYLVADQYGYVHCFWTEILFENGDSVIKYARFDGTTWTKPNDIYLTNQEIKNVSPVVDQQGILRITWSEGLFGLTFYSYAPANSALSVQNWSRPLQIQVPARPVNMRVDSQGVLHIVYINPSIEGGVYYTRSEDDGITWSEPTWLDPDVPINYIPDSLSFELDDQDGLHAVWWYGNRDRSGHPDWVRYMHSLDGGHTWSAPVLLDKHVDEIDHNLTVASPRMIVQGQTVHVIWAAGSLPYRNHRYSTDAGRTWSDTVQVFGELHGQAFDGLAVDGSGRVHFFGQIRYPMGIYHAYWDHNRWGRPSLVYLIAAEGSEDDFGDRVHAHHTLPVIRAGNQLVLTFGDGPAEPTRRLFVTYRTMDDILPLESMPTPIPSATPIPVASPTPRESILLPTPTPAVRWLGTEGAQPLEELPEPDSAIRLALIPAVLVLAGTMIFQWLNRRKY